jgi:S-adenosylmethionine synthetase
MSYTLYTSESVCAGHPDKICDQISDAILDAALREDPLSRVAVETLVTTNRVVLAGEVTTRADLNYEQIARDVIRRLGYTNGIYNFNYESPISIYVHQQAPDIAQGVDTGGAGDQGIMYGYASNETAELMPATIAIAHRLAEKIDNLRESKALPYLRPDGKTKVTLRYENGKPVEVLKLVMAVPHDQNTDKEIVKKDLYQKAVVPVLENYGLEASLDDLILNGTGKWDVGGPHSDAGLTGRKIIVDTYGGIARHGGGAFSGKDATKVDRSGAYGARYVAKNIVAAGLADKAEVKVAYVIGQAKPTAKDIETFGTAKVSDKALQKFADKILDLSVPGILETLDLRRPIYEKTAAYGHFGRDGFPWEEVVS